MNIFQIVLQVLSLIGALVLFLFGMKIMSESLQKIAGQKLRKVLAKITSKPARGILTGLSITALIQSSSATTVLLVSFVNAGLISFTQSIGIIFGANIGTTATAWLISLVGFGSAFSLYSIMLPIVALSLPLFFSYTSKNKARAEFIIGFALLFIGIYFFKENIPAIGENTEFIRKLQFSDNGFVSTLMFIGLGILVTIIFQSSSATITLTMILASQGWFSFGAALAMVLGENIGTTATANFAAIIANRSAKRTALAHLLFNLLGLLWALPLLGIISDSIQGIMHNLVNNPTHQVIFGIALFHTGFNSINTALLSLLITPFTVLCFKIVPNGNRINEEFSLKFIDNNLLSTSELSILQARKKIAHMAKQTTLIFSILPDLLIEKKEKKFTRLFDKIQNGDKIIDEMKSEISTYISKIPLEDLSDHSTERTQLMLKIIDYLKNIARLSHQISQSIAKKNEEKVWFTQQLRNNVFRELELIEKMLHILINILGKDYSDAHIEGIKKTNNELIEARNKHKVSYSEEINREKLPIKTGAYYKNLLLLSNKISDRTIGVVHLICTSNPNTSLKSSNTIINKSKSWTSI